MANGEHSDPGVIAFVLEVVKYVLAAVGTVLMAIGGWLFREYTSDRRKIKKHEEALEQITADMGTFLAFKKHVEEGPYGVDLKDSLEAGDQKMNALEEADAVLHDEARELKRESEVRFAQLDGKLDTVIERISGLKDAITRLENK